jgi:hypothetical protein
MKATVTGLILLLLFSFSATAHAWHIEFNHTELPIGVHAGNGPFFSLGDTKGLYINRYLSFSYGPTGSWSIGETHWSSPDGSITIPYIDYFSWDFIDSANFTVNFKIIEPGNQEIIPLELDVHASIESSIESLSNGDQRGFDPYGFAEISLATSFDLNMFASAQYNPDDESNTQQQTYDSKKSFLTNTWHTITFDYERYAEAGLIPGFQRSFSQEELDTFIAEYGEAASITISPHTDFKFNLNIAPADYSPVPIPSAVWLLGSGLVGLAGIRRKTRPN